MAWNDHARLLTIKAIGTVESNLTYSAINYNDPITVGVGQWYGTRAAKLLKSMTNLPEYGQVAASLRTDLQNNASDNAGYWTDRYLTRAEGNSLKPLLTSSGGVAAQNAEFIASIESYKPSAIKRGINPETNTAAFIYYCAMYHQSPKYSNQVAVAAGSNATLDRLHAVALNHPWYSKFKTRCNTVKRIIESNDISGVPAGFIEEPDNDMDGGEPTLDLGGGSDETVQTPDGRLVESGEAVNYVARVGSQLHIHMGNGKILTAQPTPNGDYWIVGGDAVAGPVVPPPSAPDPSPTVPPDDPTVPPPNAALADKIVHWMTSREGKFGYSQGAGRDNPDKSGVGDCSSTVRRAYRDMAGIEVGTWTGDQQRYGRVVWSSKPGNSYGKKRGDIPSLSVLQKADLIFFAWGSNARITHVEMYAGNGKVTGHGGKPPMGPTTKDAVGYMSWGNPYIVVRRHL